MEVSGQLQALAALPPGKEPLVPTGYEAGWAPESVWTLWNKEISYPCRESHPDSLAAQAVAIPTELSWLQQRVRKIKIRTREGVFKYCIVA
jgi:hypothetical protein